MSITFRVVLLQSCFYVQTFAGIVSRGLSGPVTDGPSRRGFLRQCRFIVRCFLGWSGSLVIGIVFLWTLWTRHGRPLTEGFFKAMSVYRAVFPGMVRLIGYWDCFFVDLVDGWTKWTVWT